jgi:hypothetical protein
MVCGLRRRVFASVAMAAALVMTAAATAAWAQEATGSGYDNANAATNAVDSSSYDRGLNVSVRQRPRPDYQAMGIHAGGFMIYPKASVGVAYDDNIYALQKGAVGDAIITAAPEIDIQSTWSRNALSAYIKAQQDWYTKYSSENATQFGGGAAGKYEFGQSTFTAGVDSGQFVLPRSASNNSGFSKKRIQYDLTSAYAQLAHEFTRLRLSGRFDYQDYNYQNGRTNAGALVFEKDQDRQTFTYTGKAEFALSPDTAVYLTAAGNNRQYGLAPPTVAFTRNSSGYEVDVGANFDLTHLLRGEVQVGYLDQEYTSHLFRPISGVSAKAQLEWFPTQLTTVTLQGSRAVGDSGVIGSAGYFTSNASLQVDHELLRNVILTANGWVGNDQYNGVNRNDDRDGVGISADWLLNRRVGLTLAYTYADQRSSGTAKGPSFSDNRVSLTTVLQF